MPKRSDEVWLVSDLGLGLFGWFEDERDPDSLVEEVLWSFPRPFSSQRAEKLLVFSEVRRASAAEVAAGKAERRARVAEAAEELLGGVRSGAEARLTSERAIPYRDRQQLPARDLSAAGAVERDRERRVRRAMAAPGWGAKVEREVNRALWRIRARGQEHSRRLAAELLLGRGKQRRHRPTSRSGDPMRVPRALEQLLESWQRELPGTDVSNGWRLYERCAARAGLSRAVGHQRLANRICVLESHPGASSTAIARAEDALRKRRLVTQAQ